MGTIAMTPTPDAPLVQVDYEDPDGLWWVVRVPQGEEANAHMGIPVGPPDVSSLDLPEAVAKRLHNELFRRRLLTARDLRGRGVEVVAALQAAYRVDAAAVTALYR
jgi:hypothetical protein